MVLHCRLEVDLLLGKWAKENVHKLSEEELAEYETLLNQETIAIFKYISGQSELPEELNTDIMRKLIEYAKSSPLGKADPKQYAASKKYYRLVILRCNL